MSALVVAAGAGSAATLGSACPSDTCALPNVNIINIGCGDRANAPANCDTDNCDIASVIDNICSDRGSTCADRAAPDCEATEKVDPGCAVGGLTIDDIYKAIANCDSDNCDITSAIENICSDRGLTCTVSDRENNKCEGTDCESTECEGTECKNTDCEGTDCDPSRDDKAENNAPADTCSDDNCAEACPEGSDCGDCTDCSETPSNTACTDSDCPRDTAKENNADLNVIQKNTYNIADLLKAFGIDITTDTTCGEDGCGSEAVPQPADTQSGSETEESTEPTDISTDIPYEISDYEAEVIRLVNDIRASYGLGELTPNKDLSAVARIKAEDMRDNHYFNHNSPTYGSPFDMMKQFGISYRTAGENIAMGQRTPQEVVDGWMNSDGHRANILNASFTQIGVGYADGGNYWSQMFIG